MKNREQQVNDHQCYPEYGHRIPKDPSGESVGLDIAVSTAAGSGCGKIRHRKPRHGARADPAAALQDQRANW